MYTTHIKDDQGNEYWFAYSGDYSGVTSVREPDATEENGLANKENGLIRIPIEVMEQFVVDKERTRLLAYIQKLDLSSRRGRQLIQRLAYEAGV
jgi:hypothetical protein